MQSAGAWSCGGGYRGQGQVGRTVKAGWPQGNLLSGSVGRGANPELRQKGLVGSPCTPACSPAFPVSPGFSRRKMGCPAGWAPGRGAGLSRAPPLPTPPATAAGVWESRARQGLLPGRNHPARRRRVGCRHLTARPRPPASKGAVASARLQMAPSRPARPLARARRGPAREHLPPAAGVPPPCPEPAGGPRQPPRALLATQRGGLPAGRSP